MKYQLHLSRLGTGLLAAAFLAASPGGQSSGVVVVTMEKPPYPAEMQTQKIQGNVVLAGIVVPPGRIVHPILFTSTNSAFSDKAQAAFLAWKVTPATWKGTPIASPINASMEFRLDEERGKIPSPMLGNLEIFPAGPNGKIEGPDGFPLRRNQTARIRATVDIPVSSAPSTYRVRVEEIRPVGRPAGVADRRMTAPGKAPNIRLVVDAPPPPRGRAPGIYRVHVTVDGQEAGSGIFWVTDDPAHFDWKKAPRAG
jgi:Gram-negative bacterial TonB protein C-terminal